MKSFNEVFFIRGDENKWLIRFKLIYLMPVSLIILFSKYLSTGKFEGRVWLEDLKLGWFLSNYDS